MNVLIYSGTFYPSIGGMETVMGILARGFQLQGHKVHVVTETPQTGDESLPISISRRPGFFKLLSLCRANDVILSSPLSLKRLVVFLLSMRRVVIHHPNPFTDPAGRVRWRDQLKKIMCRFVINAVPGKFMAGFFPNPIIIPNPYDDKLFYSHGATKRSKALFVGRLDVVKGVDILLLAIRHLYDQGLHCDLTVVGEGPELSNLKSQCLELGLGECVSFIGPKRGAELAAIMRDHAILVIPSTYKEPFGVVALEGLASGCALIVSREGGLLDASGTHALTFRNGDDRELAARLRTLLLSSSEREDLLKNVDRHLEIHRSSVVIQSYANVLLDAAHRSDA